MVFKNGCKNTKFFLLNIVIANLMLLHFNSSTYGQYAFRGDVYVKEMEAKRKRLILNADSTYSNYKFIFSHVEAFFYASQNYAKDRNDSIRLDGVGKRLFKKAIDYIYQTAANDTTFSEWGFTTYPMMQCYTRYKNCLYATDTQRVRNFVRYNDFSIGNTGNLVLMGAVGAYLAAQNFGEAWLINGYGGSDKTGLKSVIIPRLGSSVYYEISEISSSPYGKENTDPILTVALLSKDTSLRRKALVTFETMMTEYAVCWLNGHLAKSSTRTYPHNAANGQVGWGSWGYYWYFLTGGDNRWVDSAAYQYKKNSEYNQLSAAVQVNYVLPEIIYQVAIDKRLPQTIKNLNWEGRFSSTFLTYINKRYAMNTSTVRIGGTNYWKTGIRWNIDDSLTFFQRSDNNNFFITKPTVDTVLHNGCYNDQDCENVSLYEGTMYAVYNTNFKADSIFYALGYVPGGYKTFINESSKTGRIYLFYPNMLLAVSASNPFVWNPKTPTLAPSPHKDNSEFRIFDSTNCFGIVIETALPDDFKGGTDSITLLNFRNKIAGSSIPIVTNKKKDASAKPRLAYTDYKGNKLIMNFRYDWNWDVSTDTVNGQVQDYFNYPKFSSLYVNRNKCFNVNKTTGRVTPDSLQPMMISYGSCIRTYDYKSWTATQVCKELQPFQFLSIRGTKDTVAARIDWTVVGQDSINKYEVQKSVDGINFTPIAVVPKSVFFSNSAQYFIYDSLQTSSIPLYYRVRAVFNNLISVFSEIVVLAPNSVSASKLLLYPNPIKRGQNLMGRLLSSKQDTLQYRLLSVSGKQLYFGKVLLVKGYNATQLPIPYTLPASVYFLQWQTSLEKNTNRLVIEQ
jgi:hypothetical protein